MDCTILSGTQTMTKFLAHKIYAELCYGKLVVNLGVTELFGPLRSLRSALGVGCGSLWAFIGQI